MIRLILGMFISYEKWLAEIFSGMKMGYDDRFPHQKWLN